MTTIIPLYASKIPEVMPTWASVSGLEPDGTYLVYVDVGHVDYLAAARQALSNRVPPENFYAQFGFEVKVRSKSIGFWSSKIPEVLPGWASAKKLGNVYLVEVDASNPNFIASVEEVSSQQGVMVGELLDRYGFDMIEQEGDNDAIAG
ncbi:hypothetical protein COO91_01968 [Nostoc flagelliforme CCNUN1]|uniref:Uncharacterized protein n=1 Tax=Nostoc flagelliforme CCNUN1 TaxID=2038116 RepID=A0A2K8SKU7_9NOSO|nr:hypothetical protein [Nostoc flagelliforme]AUB36069.1 hypothetical protein COO91_01968 [Nostoc flagelliforme CCNUN1]